MVSVSAFFPATISKTGVFSFLRQILINVFLLWTMLLLFLLLLHVNLSMGNSFAAVFKFTVYVSSQAFLWQKRCPLPPGAMYTCIFGYSCYLYLIFLLQNLKYASLLLHSDLVCIWWNVSLFKRRTKLAIGKDTF